MIFLCFVSRGSYVNKIYNFFHQKIRHTKRRFLSLYSSKSDSGKYVFYAYSNKKIGIDVEHFKKRSIDFLDSFSNEEYEILGGKNWGNFYILWTAKESIIKYQSGSLGDMEKILLKYYGEIKKEISGILFSAESIFQFQDKYFFLYSGKNENYIYSVCIKSKK